MENQFFNFKNTIKEFLKLDEEIRGLAKAKASRMKLRDKLSKSIMEYYKKNQIHSLDVNEYNTKQQLALVESERHPAVNQNFLRNALAKYCNNDQIVNNMIDHILEERDHTSKVSFKLKRIIPNNKKKKGAEPEFDAMSLVKEDESTKIKNRFAILADFAIIKDGIEPLEKNDMEIIMNKITNDDNNKNIEKTRKVEEEKEREKEKIRKLEEEKIRKIEEEKIRKLEEEKIRKIEEEKSKKIKQEQEKTRKIEQEKEKTRGIEENEYDDDDEEDEVDLDNIPEENTGYSDEPPSIDIEIEKGNTLKNIICQKLDQMNQKEFIGSIPVPIKKQTTQTQQTSIQQPQLKQQSLLMLNELENKAVQSFNILKNYSKNNPILYNWLQIQQEKIKYIKTKEQIKTEQFNIFMNNLNIKEKELDKHQFNNEINKLKLNIINYITYKIK